MLRSAGNFIVASTVSVAMLMSAAAWAGSDSNNITLAQDDWVRLPSSASNADSEHTSHSSSKDSQVAADHPRRGRESAEIKIVEYSDFQCPYCRKSESSLRQVLKKYGDRVQLVYMDFPLSFHQHAMEAAIAARCADEQGHFWAYHDALFANPSGLSTSALKTTAAELGLEPVSFDTCLDERRYESAVAADMRQGERAGVSGTPYFIVDGHPMNGDQPTSAFESVIDNELRRR